MRISLWAMFLMSLTVLCASAQQAQPLCREAAPFPNQAQKRIVCGLVSRISALENRTVHIERKHLTGTNGTEMGTPGTLMAVLVHITNHPCNGDIVLLAGGNTSGNCGYQPSPETQPQSCNVSLQNTKYSLSCSDVRLENASADSLVIYTTP